uniref:(northern house mosquito) hypothetical protein n=1 Tax=Culex pipiens TaxID=7175 RepID=A0A8D8B4E3_CULPI
MSYSLALADSLDCLRLQRQNISRSTANRPATMQETTIAISVGSSTKAASWISEGPMSASMYSPQYSWLIFRHSLTRTLGFSSSSSAGNGISSSPVPSDRPLLRRFATKCSILLSL